MRIGIIFKNGFYLSVNCEEFTLYKNVLDVPTGYEIKGVTNHEPMYIDWDEVACVFRDLEGEKVSIWENG